jgi:hypothetical protein
LAAQLPRRPGGTEPRAAYRPGKACRTKKHIQTLCAIRPKTVIKLLNKIVKGIRIINPMDFIVEMEAKDED